MSGNHKSKNKIHHFFKVVQNELIQKKTHNVDSKQSTDIMGDDNDKNVLSVSLDGHKSFKRQFLMFFFVFVYCIY